MRAQLSLLKNISNESKILGRKASLERAKSCPRAEQRMKIIGEYGRIYTRTHRFALLSLLWLSSYIKKVFITKKARRTVTRVFKVRYKGETWHTASGYRFTKNNFKESASRWCIEVYRTFWKALDCDVSCWLWMKELIVRVFTLQRVCKYSHVLWYLCVYARVYKQAHVHAGI